jgi:hypothetical protein
VPAKPPTIASGAIQKLASTIAELGGDPAAMLAKVGLDPAVIADPDGRVPLVQLHALWEAVIAVFPRADGAVFGAQRYSPGDYGLVGFVAMNSASLRDAIEQVVRFLGLWTDEPGIELENDGTLKVRDRTPFDARPRSPRALPGRSA